MRREEEYAMLDTQIADLKAKVEGFEKLCAIHPGGDCLQCKSFANGHRDEFWRLQLKLKDAREEHNRLHMEYVRADAEAKAWEEKYSHCLIAHDTRLMACSLTNHQAREALEQIQANELIQHPKIFDMVIAALGISQAKGERIVAAMKRVCNASRNVPLGEDAVCREMVASLIALDAVEKEEE